MRNNLIDQSIQNTDSHYLKPKLDQILKTMPKDSHFLKNNDISNIQKINGGQVGPSGSLIHYSYADDDRMNNKHQFLQLNSHPQRFNHNQQQQQQQQQANSHRNESPSMIRNTNNDAFPFSLYGDNILWPSSAANQQEQPMLNFIQTDRFQTDQSILKSGNNNYYRTMENEKRRDNNLDFLNNNKTNILNGSNSQSNYNIISQSYQDSSKQYFNQLFTNKQNLDKSEELKAGVTFNSFQVNSTTNQSNNSSAGGGGVSAMRLHSPDFDRPNTALTELFELNTKQSFGHSNSATTQNQLKKNDRDKQSGNEYFEFLNVHSNQLNKVFNNDQKQPSGLLSPQPQLPMKGASMMSISNRSDSTTIGHNLLMSNQKSVFQNISSPKQVPLTGSKDQSFTTSGNNSQASSNSQAYVNAMKALQDRLKSLQDRLEKQEREKNELKRALNLQQNRNQHRYQEKIVEMKEKEGQINIGFENLMNDNRKLKQALQSLESQRVFYQTENLKLKKERNEISEQYVEKIQKLNNLLTTTKRQSEESLEQMRAQNQQVVVQLKVERSNCQDQILESSNQAKRFQQENQELRVSNDEKNRETQELRKHLRNQEDRLQSLQNELEEYQRIGSVQNIHIQIQQLEQRLGESDENYQNQLLTVREEGMRNQKMFRQEISLIQLKNHEFLQQVNGLTLENQALHSKLNQYSKNFEDFPNDSSQKLRQYSQPESHMRGNYFFQPNNNLIQNQNLNNNYNSAYHQVNNSGRSSQNYDHSEYGNQNFNPSFSNLNKNNPNILDLQEFPPTNQINRHTNSQGQYTASFNGNNANNQGSGFGIGGGGLRNSDHQQQKQDWGSNTSNSAQIRSNYGHQSPGQINLNKLPIYTNATAAGTTAGPFSTQSFDMHPGDLSSGQGSNFFVQTDRNSSNFNNNSNNMIMHERDLVILGGGGNHGSFDQNNYNNNSNNHNNINNSGTGGGSSSQSQSRQNNQRSIGQINYSKSANITPHKVNSRQNQHQLTNLLFSDVANNQEREQNRKKRELVRNISFNPNDKETEHMLSNNPEYQSVVNLIKETQKEISILDGKYQNLVVEAQNENDSQRKSELRRALMDLSDIIQKETQKIYALQKKEENILNSVSNGFSNY